MKHRISTKNKIQIAVICVLYTLLLLVLFCLIAEDRGFFPGKLLDRPFADAYVRKNYPGVKFRLVKSSHFSEIKNDFGVDFDSRGYRYVYEITETPDASPVPLSAGGTFTVETYNFKVIYDEIFDRYTFDAALEDSFSSWLLKGFETYAADKGLAFTPFEVFSEVQVSKGSYDGADGDEHVSRAIEDGVLSRSSPVLHVKGSKIDFEQYKEAISEIVGIYDGDGIFADDSLIPSSLRVFYHYDEDGKDVTAYESQFQSYQLKYDPGMAAAASNTHFKVLLDSKEIGQVKAFTIVKSVYIWVIIFTVAVLLGFWAYRRIRRLSVYN